MNETLDAHAVARLAIEAAPHLELLNRIGGHLDIVLRAAAALGSDWGEIQEAMDAAASAPPAMRPAFYRATWETYGKKYGLSPELMGALAGEKRGRCKAEVPPAPAEPISPLPPVAILPPAPRASTSATPDVLDAVAPLIKAWPGTMSDLEHELRRMEVVVGANRLSSIRTGNLAKSLRAGQASSGISYQRASDLYAAMTLLTEERQVKPPAPPVPPIPKPAPTPTPPQESAPAPTPASRRSRESLVAAMLVANNGRVHIKEVARACQISHGAAVSLLNGMGDLRHMGGGTYRLI